MSDENVEPRAKRQKTDKFGRFAALKKLKELKGSKHKYEVDEIDNVYDNVDESEYTKRILERQDDDWIVDDAGGSGYVEDGREVFDDDLDSESIANASAMNKGKKRKKKHVSENVGKGNIQFMMSNLPAKKKEDVNLDEDNILSELLTEIDKPDSKVGIKPKAISNFSLIAEKKAIGNYMKSFAANKPKVKKEIVIADDIEDEIEDSLAAESQIEVLEQTQTSTLNDVDNKKSKLLFHIAEPIKTIPKVESLKIEAEEEHGGDIFFDDDFDFSEMDAEVNAVNVSETKATEFVDDLNFGDNEDIFDDLTVDMSEMNQDTNSFTFYWWDAYEDAKNKPGVVLLFGKTYSEEDKKFNSCCVVVKNIERKIFLLPRKYKLNEAFEPTNEEVTFEDVYEEFNTEMKNNDQILSYKSKKVMKHYAFDSSIPMDSEYLEVRYTGNINFLTKRFSTISRIFGANSGFLEILLLDRKIKGPCWLSVKNADASVNPFTYSTIEMTCDKYSNVSVIHATKTLPPPPLVVLALNIKLAVNNKGENQIAMISSLINNRYYVDKQAPTPPFQEHFCVITKLSDQMLPADMHSSLSKYKATKVQKMDSERALLNYFLGKFCKIDPDLIVGHDMNGYQLNILGERLMKTNVQNFSRLSKIKRSNSNFNKYTIEKSLFAGRLVCDIKLSAKELIKSRSYDLDSLCQYVLKVPEGHRIEIEPENVASMYTNSFDLFKMISLVMQDTAYILKMMYELSVLPLALQITNIAGNVMSRTLMGGRSERNEYLLMHAFNERDYIVPEKFLKKKDDFEKTSSSRKKKPAYSGGLVLDPKVGFYDKMILLMDFNSLYPSIIQEYNICFTTINLSDGDEITLPDKSIAPGILPSEIRKLVESRREVKKLMNNPDLSQDLQMQYNIRQMALKLTANSMYGCLGFSNSRFYAKPLAALVTQKGREILINTKDIAQKLMFDVIYGDTDSIMINTNSIDYEQVFKIGKSIKQEINKMYKQVELDIDGVFKYLLLLKKKKYAAVTLVKGKNGQLNEVQEIKGLDIVRRDWSQLAASAGRMVLNQILCEQTPDERVENIFGYLSKLKEEIAANKVPLQLLVITKQLTKNPILYADSKSLPHVQVALRHNKSKGKKFKAGDTVPYIICDDGTSNPATQRAYLIEELKSSSDLKIDTNYYLAQQIHPVISRICEPIEGASAYEIANCLDIKASNFVKKPSEKIEHESFKLEKTFRNAEPFAYKCFGCKNVNTVSGLLVNKRLAFEKCANSECNVRPAEYTHYIKNVLVKTVRTFVERYYANEMTCEDPGCPNSSARLPQMFVNKYPICTLCKSGVMYKKYTENDLYSQLMSYKHLFDVSKVDKKLLDPTLEVLYNTCKSSVENVLKSSGFCTINLNELFAGFTISSKQAANTAVEHLDLLNAVDDDEFDSGFQ